MKNLKYILFMIPLLFVSINSVKADTFVPTSRIQYYEGYAENFNTGSMSFHEYDYSYGTNIIPPLTPGYAEHPYAISLLLDGNYKSGSTYIFEATLHANIPDYSSFKFYYPDIRYMAWFARLGYLEEKLACNFDMVIENSRFDITCSYQPSSNSSRAIISFVNYDYVNNGYLTYDDLGTYFKWDNINIQLYSDSSGAIIEQNQTIINQNDTIINQNNKTNEELSDLNDNITNDDVSGVEESFSQFEDFLDDNSTITQLITLPVTLYSSILQGVSNSCTPFNLGNLYGESLVLPCVNIGNYLGSTLWGMIDLIISGFAIYSISKKLIKVFNNFSSMKDGDVIDD